jgi:hypothetical protein
MLAVALLPVKGFGVIMLFSPANWGKTAGWRFHGSVAKIAAMNRVKLAGIVALCTGLLLFAAGVCYANAFPQILGAMGATAGALLLMAKTGVFRV